MSENELMMGHEEGSVGVETYFLREKKDDARFPYWHVNNLLVLKQSHLYSLAVEQVSRPFKSQEERSVVFQVSS